MRSETSQSVHKPSRIMAAVRVVLVTIIVTLLCFALGLFFGIVGVFLANVAKGGGLNMNLAYRHVAFPIAVAALIISFIGALVSEIRHYRRIEAEYHDQRRAA